MTPAELEAELFNESRQELSDHCAIELGKPLLESELRDLWSAATKSCRKEIRRLERLVEISHIAIKAERNRSK